MREFLAAKSSATPACPADSVRYDCRARGRRRSRQRRVARARGHVTSAGYYQGTRKATRLESTQSEFRSKDGMRMVRWRQRSRSQAAHIWRNISTPSRPCRTPRHDPKRAARVELLRISMSRRAIFEDIVCDLFWDGRGRRRFAMNKTGSHVIHIGSFPSRCAALRVGFIVAAADALRCSRSESTQARPLEQMVLGNIAAHFAAHVPEFGGGARQARELIEVQRSIRQGSRVRGRRRYFYRAAARPVDTCSSAKPHSPPAYRSSGRNGKRTGPSRPDGFV